MPNGEWKIYPNLIKPKPTKYRYVEINLQYRNLQYLNEQLEKFKDENINYFSSEFLNDTLNLSIEIPNDNYDKEILEYEKNIKIYEKEKEIMIKLNSENRNLKLDRLIHSKKESLVKLEEEIKRLEKEKINESN